MVITLAYDVHTVSHRYRVSLPDPDGPDHPQNVRIKDHIMKAYLFLLNLLLAVAFSPEATNAQSETADDLFPESTQILTLDLQHVDRYYFSYLWMEK